MTQRIFSKDQNANVIVMADLTQHLKNTNFWRRKQLTINSLKARDKVNNCLDHIFTNLEILKRSLVAFLSVSDQSMTVTKLKLHVDKH